MPWQLAAIKVEIGIAHTGNDFFFNSPAKSWRAYCFSFAKSYETIKLSGASRREQIERLFQVGKLIRNELDNDRDAWRSQADRLRQLVG